MNEPRQEWLCGRHAVKAALLGGSRAVQEVWLRQPSRQPQGSDLQRIAADCGVTVQRVDAERMHRALGEDASVAARCGPYRYRAEADLPTADPDGSLVVVLDGIQDPQNLGAIARTAEAAGAKAVIIAERRAAAVTPAVVRASAGATEYLRIHRVVNVVRALDRLSRLGYWRVGLAPDGEESWCEVDYRGGVALVIGREGAGLRRLVAERCDHLVSLQMRGRVESLNASAAFAAVAYEVVRQQDLGNQAVAEV